MDKIVKIVMPLLFLNYSIGAWYEAYQSLSTNVFEVDLAALYLFFAIGLFLYKKVFWYLCVFVLLVESTVWAFFAYDYFIHATYFYFKGFSENEYPVEVGAILILIVWLLHLLCITGLFSNKYRPFMHSEPESNKASSPTP